MTKNFKSGFAAIIGMPNVGKSTFISRFMQSSILDNIANYLELIRKDLNKSKTR